MYANTDSDVDAKQGHLKCNKNTDIQNEMQSFVVFFF